MHLQDAYRSRLLLLSNRLLTYIFYRRKSSPLTHDPQSGHAADVTFLTEIAKFTNFTFFRDFVATSCSPFVMEIKTHPSSDAADYKFFYKRLSTPCKFWFQYEKHWAKEALQYRINAKTMHSVWRCRCLFLYMEARENHTHVFYCHLVYLKRVLALYLRPYIP